VSLIYSVVLRGGDFNHLIELANKIGTCDEEKDVKTTMGIESNEFRESELVRELLVHHFSGQIRLLTNM